jgi:hypothetical protein
MRRICPDLERLRNAHNEARDVYLSAVEQVILSNAYSVVGDALIAFVTVKERERVLRQHSIGHACDRGFVISKYEPSKLDKAMIGAYFAGLGFAMFFLSLLKNPG